MEEKLHHRVRAAIKDLGPFTIDDLIKPLCIQSYDEKAKVRGAVKWFKRSGEVATVRPGTYCYQPKQKPFPLIEKMWRGMLIKGTFTRRDIVILSGATKKHARNYITFLLKAGIIERVCSKRSYADTVYRLYDPDNAPLDHPLMPTRKKRKR